MKTRQIATDAMLAALCAVLGYLAVDLGNLKITFESLPVLLGALLFGPLDGLCVGGIGTLLYQVIRYGITVTTPLWMMPYLLIGLLVGLYAKRCSFALTAKRILGITIAAELLIAVLNTGVLYVDSIIFGYYSAAYIFGTLGVRLLLCIGKGVAFGMVLPVILRAAHKGMRQ
ncbi:MAG: ECF transporter S component [Clostridiales bacterium]|nr:ECF transporter S component [Clostridiales bacterium]